MPVRKYKSDITLIKKKVAKDTEVVVNYTLALEDEFTTMYDATKVNAAILPPFNPLVLKRLCTRNNILMQCIHAMETNIDGTGFEIVDDSNSGKPKAIDPQLQAAVDASKSPSAAQAKAGLPGTAVDPLKLLENIKGTVPTAAPAVPGKPGAGVGAKETNTAAAAAGVEAGITDAAAAAANVESGKVLPFNKKPADPTAADPNAPPDAGAPPTTPPPPIVEPEDPEKLMLEGFFKEPFPNESFVAIRRKLRVDIEATGNGYMEIIRNAVGDIVFLRHLDASTMRLIKLDGPVLVEKTIERAGTTVKASIWVRERRFVQRVGINYIYFKEFGSERQLNRDTGAWLDAQNSNVPLGAYAPKNQDIPSATAQPIVSFKADAQSAMDGVGPAASQKYPADDTSIKPGSEVMHFICDKDATTPYGIPRWINNLPAVLGSRKAEEFNLGFFDAGGLPPAIVFIQGGALADTVKQQLQAYLAGGPENKHRGAIVEAQSSSGSLDSAGQVKVTVERFGDTRQNDSMFQNYDIKCEDHTRGAFRLPAIFLGKAQDYNFATALTAVMVTEAQVFAPERTEFDEMINHTIVRALGAKTFMFKSLPITLKNADLQLKAIPLVAPKIDGADLVDAVNKITGLSLSYSQSAEQSSNALSLATAAKAAAQAGAVGGSTMGGGSGGGSSSGAGMDPGLGKASDGGGGGSGSSSVAMKAELTSNDIVLLANEWANAVGLADGPTLDKELRRAIVVKVEKLSKEQRTLFNAVVATATFTKSAFDQQGLAELAGCCVDAMHAR